MTLYWSMMDTVAKRMDSIKEQALYSGQLKTGAKVIKYPQQLFVINMLKTRILSAVFISNCDLNPTLLDTNTPVVGYKLVLGKLGDLTSNRRRSHLNNALIDPSIDAKLCCLVQNNSDLAYQAFLRFDLVGKLLR
ncbi:Hypothetical predicted protein [Octopus vulgaris]|uniref:Uncharacterized protein n=1 Tax=Octopus vulgaris TaxID=6645 RepID=A0AA36B2P6_OCTVU|nr:Hypothetical predicted protein [Octopus vulgaris]